MERINWVIGWVDAPEASDGVMEREFHTAGADGIVPGISWLPDLASRACPLVLLGHGASGHKRSDRILSLGRWFAATAGLAALAIDGPYHGDRVASPLAPAEYQGRMLDEGLDVVAGRMTNDWQAAVEAVASVANVDATRLGYLGLSMGTRFGLPFWRGGWT